MVSFGNANCKLKINVSSKMSTAVKYKYVVYFYPDLLLPTLLVILFCASSSTLPFVLLSLGWLFLTLRSRERLSIPGAYLVLLRSN